LPVAGVVAQGNGPAVVGAEAALGGEEEELLAAEFGGVPAHAGVLRPAEQVATGRVPQQLVGERQLAGRPRGGGGEVVDGRVLGFNNGEEAARRGHRNSSSPRSGWGRFAI